MAGVVELPLFGSHRYERDLGGGQFGRAEGVPGVRGDEGEQVRVARVVEACGQPGAESGHETLPVRRRCKVTEQIRVGLVESLRQCMVEGVTVGGHIVQRVRGTGR